MLELPEGSAIGASYRWPGGQYSLSHLARIVGCGLFDVQVAGEFGMAVAIAKGTPGNPLCEPEVSTRPRSSPSASRPVNWAFGPG